MTLRGLTTLLKGLVGGTELLRNRIKPSNATKINHCFQTSASLLATRNHYAISLGVTEAAANLGNYSTLCNQYRNCFRHHASFSPMRLQTCAPVNMERYKLSHLPNTAVSPAQDWPYGNHGIGKYFNLCAKKVEVADQLPNLNIASIPRHIRLQVPSSNIRLNHQIFLFQSMRNYSNISPTAMFKGLFLIPPLFTSDSNSQKEPARNSTKNLSTKFHRTPKVCDDSTNELMCAAEGKSEKLASQEDFDWRYIVREKQLPLLENKMQVTYMWVDDDGLRYKNRLLQKTPQFLRNLPSWNTNIGAAEEELSLVPRTCYGNPFESNCDNVLLMCDIYSPDGCTKKYNKRVSCLKTISRAFEHEPWFGFKQEYVLLDSDGRPITDNQFYKAAFELAKNHLKACSHAGLSFYGNVVEKGCGKWQYKVGPAPGIQAADDLWMSRYILKRSAEMMGLQVAFNRKSLGSEATELCTRINFSTKEMREKNGVKAIMKAIRKLSKQTPLHMEAYNINDLEGRKKHARFSWGVGNKDVSVRVPRTVVKAGCGYIEDRRPSANCDPYAAIQAITSTCLLK